MSPDQKRPYLFLSISIPMEIKRPSLPCETLTSNSGLPCLKVHALPKGRCIHMVVYMMHINMIFLFSRNVHTNDAYTKSMVFPPGLTSTLSLHKGLARSERRGNQPPDAPAGLLQRAPHATRALGASEAPNRCSSHDDANARIHCHHLR